MKIRLLKLIPNNFKGFNFPLIINGKNVNVFGANATGKTTVVDEWAWLLTDKDSLGRSSFAIKNLDAQGESQHGLEHSVEGVLEIEKPIGDNGDADLTTIALKKVYKEVWTKKRGSAESTFSGHTTDYLVNGVPTQEKEYREIIKEIVGDEGIFRLLTSPTAYPALPPIPTLTTLKSKQKTQREILLEVCGDITDEDVIASDKALTELPTILKGRKMDDHKKVIVARRSEINKTLESIPVRIDEVNKGLPDVTGLDADLIYIQKTDAENALNDKKLELQGVNTGGRIAELSKALALVNADISKEENEQRSRINAELAKITREINDIEVKGNSRNRRIKELTETISRKDRRLDAIEKELVALRKSWQEIDAETFKGAIPDRCAACGQSLPADEVQAASDKALAEFNRSRAQRLSRIDQQGTELAEEKEILHAEIAKMDEEFIELQTKNSLHLRLTLEELAEQRDALKAKTITVPAELLNKKDLLEREIECERMGIEPSKKQLQADITELEAILKALKADADKFVRLEEWKSRIEELMTQEKALAAEYEKLERELYLCEQFIRTKVSMLTDRINGLFETVRFKLFNVQVNGGIEECCEITVNGVPYNSGLNNAARINAGMEICSVLQKHYDVFPPVFVDNAESICELVPMDTQVIRLVVSEQDKVLRVECRERVVA